MGMRNKLVAAAVLASVLGAEGYRERQRNEYGDKLVESAREDFLAVLDELAANQREMDGISRTPDLEKLRKNRDELIQEGAGILAEMRGDLRDVCMNDSTWYLRDYPNCVYLEDIEALQAKFQQVETINVRLNHLQNDSLSERKKLLEEREEIYQEINRLIADKKKDQGK